jgi:acetyl-CoA/propionyl-CoA carboxylase biotin carboxyl carrier protein
VADASELAAAIGSARREAKAAFGDDDLLIERYVTTPRHIEIQVFADTHGNVVHLGERECSLQRRHQKVIEECPSPLLDADMRARMGAAAVEAARAVGYVGAGTVEFIVSGDTPDEFFFLEMNTRLQVEHPVTEEVYGVDLVEWQVRAAAGHPLEVDQASLVPTGHAVEARVYAEDPSRGFLPTGGVILTEEMPAGAGLRADSGITDGMTVGSAYDPMLAKLIAYGPDRDAALARLRRGLASTVIAGVVTNIPFLQATLADEDVIAGRLDTTLLERKQDSLASREPRDSVFALAGLARLWELAPLADDPGDPFDAATGWRIGEHAWARWRMRSGDVVRNVKVRGWAPDAQVQVDGGPVMAAAIEWDGWGEALVTVSGSLHHVAVHTEGDTAWISAPELGTWAVDEEDELSAARHEEEATGGTLLAPMPGTVTVVHVSTGESVTAGQTLLVVEAMKMEHPITAPVDGVVEVVHVQAGQAVAMDAPLAVVAVATE